MSSLILPDSPLFYPTLYGNLPPGAAPVGAFVIRSDSGLMEPATVSELEEYIEGGEYEEVSGLDLEDV
jgi:hypothetical protein